MATTAQTIQSTLDSANLKILRTVKQFHNPKLFKFLDGDDDDEYDDELYSDGDVDGENYSTDPSKELRDPEMVAADVSAHLSFLRKLKFQYLEHSAKDKYIKSIVSDIDDAPIVTADDNKQLNAINEAKKAKLKQAKAALADRHADIRQLAPLVEQDYNKARSLTTKAITLSQKILDARLALTRLRQTHPHPRLTIPAATATLEAQITTMQTLNDDVQALNVRVSSAKDKMRAAKVELEQVRTERAEVEKTAATGAGRLGDDDSRLIPLYDWFTASLAIHQSLTSLLTSHAASENELRLTYLVPPPSSSAPAAEHTGSELTITLLFLPNTHQLAAAHVTGLHPSIDISELVESHVQVDDVQGLVAAIMARARAGPPAT